MIVDSALRFGDVWATVAVSTLLAKHSAPPSGQPLSPVRDAPTRARGHHLSSDQLTCEPTDCDQPTERHNLAAANQVARERCRRQLVNVGFRRQARAHLPGVADSWLLIDRMVAECAPRFVRRAAGAPPERRWTAATRSVERVELSVVHDVLLCGLRVGNAERCGDRYPCVARLVPFSSWSPTFGSRSSARTAGELVVRRGYGVRVVLQPHELAVMI
jgi:hypothetical protein